MSRPTKLRVPSAPLLEYVGRREGLASILENAGIPPYRWVERLEDWVPTREYRRYEKALERGEERGWFDLFWTDAFLIDLFGVHPAGIYPDWYEIPEDELLQHRLRKPRCADECCTDDAADAA